MSPGHPRGRKHRSSLRQASPAAGRPSPPPQPDKPKPTPATALAPEERPTVSRAREKKAGIIAGIAGIVSMILTMAVLPIGASGNTVRRQGEELSELTILKDIHETEARQILALSLRAVALLLLIVLAVFLYRAIKGRNPQHSVWILRAGIVAFVVTAITTLVGFLKLSDVADVFYASGPRTQVRAEDLLDAARDGGILRISSTIQIIFGFAFGLWISLVSLECMRTGLLTRFLAIFGIAAGLTTAIGLPIGIALFLGWLGSVSLVVIGYWPGGIPPAWDAGRAVPWEEVDSMDRRAPVRS